MGSTRKSVASVILLTLIFGIPSVSLSSSGATNTFRTTQPIPTGTNNPNYTVQTWIPSQAWNGTTLFGDSKNGSVVEINMQGQVIWSYTFPKGTVPSIGILGLMYVPGSNDVLFTISNPQSLRGAYEVNRQGQIVWKYVDQEAFHDAVRLPNGDTIIDNCYAEAYSAWPYTDPQIVEVNQQGQVVWSWAAKTVYQNDSKYANIRNGNGPGDCNWTHTNEVLRLPDGNTMVSLRNFNLTVIVNTAGQLVKAFDDPCARGCGLIGHLVMPHSPLPLSNGNYLISEPVGFSDVVEFNPSTNSVVFRWPQPTQNSPAAYFIRGAQKLPNGNVLVTDSFGQLIEVTSSGQVVWKMKCTCYNNTGGTSGSPFFQAERLSYMPPGFTLSSPASRATYTSNSVPLTITAGTDLGNLTYSARNNQNGTWIIRNSTLIQNIYKDSLDSPTTTKGPSTLTLPNGNYTLRLFASRTGYGYKAFVQQKRINYATQDITFLVSLPATTTTTTTTTTSSLTTTSTKVTSITTSTAQTTPTVTTTTPSNSTTSVQSTRTSTSQTSTSQISTTTVASGSGGGIPEFPSQLLAPFILTALLIVSYLMVRRIQGRPRASRL